MPLVSKTTALPMIAQLCRRHQVGVILTLTPAALGHRGGILHIVDVARSDGAAKEKDLPQLVMDGQCVTIFDEINHGVWL